MLAAASSSWCSAEAAASSGIAGGLATGGGAGGGCLGFGGEVMGYGEGDEDCSFVTSRGPRPPKLRSKLAADASPR